MDCSMKAPSVSNLELEYMESITTMVETKGYYHVRGNELDLGLSSQLTKIIKQQQVLEQRIRLLEGENKGLKKIMIHHHLDSNERTKAHLGEFESNCKANGGKKLLNGIKASEIELNDYRSNEDDEIIHLRGNVSAPELWGIERAENGRSKSFLFRDGKGQFDSILCLAPLMKTMVSVWK